jgi:hypothetical protein
MKRNIFLFLILLCFNCVTIRFSIYDYKLEKEMPDTNNVKIINIKINKFFTTKKLIDLKNGDIIILKYYKNNIYQLIRRK